MLGSLISGALSLGAGLLQRNDSKKAQQQEYERQKEFAKSGIQWKVEDAKAADAAYRNMQFMHMPWGVCDYRHRRSRYC